MRSTLYRLALRALAGTLLAAPFASPATAIPDFSGRWGRNAFNFEPLPRGLKPVMNMERLPDGNANRSVLAGDYTSPILKPGAAEIVKHLGAMARRGIAHPDPSNQCRPYAPPYTFAMQLGLDVVPADGHITILYNQDDQVRRIWLNRAHPLHVTPTPMGDSVGHYEADSLVVDTIGIAAEPPELAMIDRFGTPRSPEMHVVERYRLIDGKAAKESALRQMREDGPRLNGDVVVDPDYLGPGLQLTLTVEDPKVFTTPWSAAVTYRRLEGSWIEQICAENLHDYYDGSAPLLPVARRPAF
jgi:hypothetical protein